MPLKILRMKDTSDSYVIKKKDIFDLPARLIISGASGMGKTSILGNLILRENAYRKDFEPENIFIFSGSLKGDIKIKTMIKELDVPEGNVYTSYNEDLMEHVYDELVDRFEEALNEKRKPEHSLVIFDDLAFSNLFAKSSKNSQIDRLFCNGRKFLISTILIIQKYTQLNTCARENATGLILGKSSNKQLELVESDFNYLNNKKEFLKMVRDNTKGKHDFMIFTPDKQDVYRTNEFKPIKLNKINTEN
jgi:hypothetical protein